VQESKQFPTIREAYSYIDLSVRSVKKRTSANLPYSQVGFQSSAIRLSRVRRCCDRSSFAVEVRWIMDDGAIRSHPANHDIERSVLGSLLLTTGVTTEKCSERASGLASLSLSTKATRLQTYPMASPRTCNAVFKSHFRRRTEEFCGQIRTVDVSDN
jgi:hypothetical protein